MEARRKTDRDMLKWVSTMMVASQGEMVGTVASSTMENGGAEMMAPVEVCVKQGTGMCEGSC